ncbi:hypothetical protein COB55_03820 [Candidatus Wolfebacteria bacterium]|nr:MAG: hypothetical protein COB55_03820 [Candidatus Wolfebacteria bacterium]
MIKFIQIKDVDWLFQPKGTIWVNDYNGEIFQCFSIQTEDEKLITNPFGTDLHLRTFEEVEETFKVI